MISSYGSQNLAEYQPSRCATDAQAVGRLVRGAAGPKSGMEYLTAEYEVEAG